MNWRWPVPALIAAFCGAIACPAQAVPSAAPPLSGSRLIDAIVAQNAVVRSYEADLSADFRERSFPFVHLRLTGTAYYRWPDQYAVVFDRAPAFMNGFARGYALMMDTAGWKRSFTIEVEPDRVVKGRPVHVLRLTASDPSIMLHHGDVLVDAASNEILEMDWFMTNGMSFGVSQEYQTTPAGFDLVAIQHATFRVPLGHGVATMTLANYRCNVAISDGMFGTDVP